MIPACIDYPHSLVTIAPEGENCNITAGGRRKFSHIFRLSPVSKDTLKFNIPDELSAGNACRDASMAADIPTSPTNGKTGGSSKHWIDTAKNLIREKTTGTG